MEYFIVENCAAGLLEIFIFSSSNVIVRDMEPLGYVPDFYMAALQHLYPDSSYRTR